MNLNFFEPLATSTLLVALAEIGDKTQLLSFMLAARFRQPRPIILGILLATLVNHALAGAVGNWLANQIPDHYLIWGVGFLFVVFGLWTLIPDSLDDDTKFYAGGAFLTSLIAFFLAEMGDKTQVATIALAARFDALAWVVAGTTLGMMLANVPAVLVGQKLADKLPLHAIRIGTAVVFILTGAITLFPVLRPWFA